jgi:hypothetical protein
MLRRFALALGAARKINTAERERFMDKLKVNPDDVEAARGSRLLDARHCSTFVGDLRIADKGGCYTYSLLEVTRADGRVIVKEVSPADRNEDSIKGLPEVAVVAVSQAVCSVIMPWCTTLTTLVCHPCVPPLCATLVRNPCVPPLYATLVCHPCVHELLFADFVTTLRLCCASIKHSRVATWWRRVTDAGTSTWMVGG